MKKNFTKKFILDNSGCYDDEQVFEYWPNGENRITLEDILKSRIPLKDKYWFVCRKLLTKEQNIKISIGVAEIVLNLYENKYPDDKRPRKAIEAAKVYLKTRNAAAAYAAYADAAAAADASFADASFAAAAAYAAYAAAYASFADVDTAYAYAYAYAAYAAYDDAAYANNRSIKALEVYLLNFCGYE